MAKRTVHQWGPNSLNAPVSQTIDDTCPVDNGQIVWDDRNKREECELCGQPIKMPKRSRSELFYVHYD